MAMKNIDQTTLLRSLDVCPRTVDDMREFCKSVDVARIIGELPDTLDSFSPIKLDLIYVILRLSNELHTRLIRTLMEQIIIPSIQNTIKCVSIRWYNILFDQFSQDLEGFVNQSIHYCLEKSASASPQRLLKRFIRTFRKLVKESVYQKACLKLNHSFDEKYIEDHRRSLQMMIENLIVEITGDYAVTASSLAGFSQDALDPLIDDDDADKIMRRLEKIIGLDDLLSLECLELELYVEEKLAAMEPDHLMEVHQEASDHGWKIVDREENRDLEAPLIDHGIFTSRYQMVSFLTDIIKRHPENLCSFSEPQVGSSKICTDSLLKLSQALESQPDFYRLMCRLFHLHIRVHSKGSTIESYGNRHGRLIDIYQKGDTYHTSVPSGQTFVKAYPEGINPKRFLQKMETSRHKALFQSLREKVNVQMVF